MKQYFAISTSADLTPVPYLSKRNILVSYFYWKKSFRERILEEHSIEELFMDSGAFSFYNSKNEVNIHEYIKCLKEDNIKKYSALDVIGDPVATKENYLLMKREGLIPIPTFHINTDIEYLYWYCENCRTLAIGGMVGGDRIPQNLDKIWSVILKRNPDIKVHGFGVTNYDIAVRYPWHSIDGSSYNQIVKFSRALEWVRKGFNIIDTKEFLQKMGYEQDEKSLGKIRNFLLYWQMEQYNRMIEDINIEHLKKDFNHLIAQQTLF